MFRPALLYIRVVHLNARYVWPQTVLHKILQKARLVSSEALREIINRTTNLLKVSTFAAVRPRHRSAWNLAVHALHGVDRYVEVVGVATGFGPRLHKF